MIKLSALKNSAVFKNSIWLIGEKVISLGFVLAINILIARQLGANDFGVLSYLLAILALLSPLSSIGFNAIVTREIVQHPNKTEIIISTALMFRFIAALIAFVLSTIVILNVELSGVDGNQWAMILFAGVNIFNCLHVVDFWFQAKLKNQIIVLCRFFNTFLFFVIKLICYLNDASLTTYIWVHAIEFFVLSVAFYSVYIKQSNRASITLVDWQYGKSLLSQSYWLILSGIASVIYLKIDQVMLGELVSSEEVGVYAVAGRLSEVWYFFATAIVTAFFPKILKLKESAEQASYQSQLQRTNDLLFLLALLIATFITVIGPWLVTFLYGDAYKEAGIILTIHIWASIFVFMRALLSKWLVAENLVKYSLFTHGIGMVVNIGFNFYLIPLYGGIGAAVSTVISYAAASYITLFFSRATWPMAMIMTNSLFSPLRLLGLGLKSASRN
ncbi:flippase [Thalassotalea montiporae]